MVGHTEFRNIHMSYGQNSLRTKTSSAFDKDPIQSLYPSHKELFSTMSHSCSTELIPIDPQSTENICPCHTLLLVLKTMLIGTMAV